MPMRWVKINCFFKRISGTVYVYSDAGVGPVQWKTAQHEGLIVEADEGLIVEAS